MACTPLVSKGAEGQGVKVRQHKLIYKYVEDIENYVYDVRREILEEEGNPQNVEILG